MRLLIIKLTSMGDILFTLSCIADIKARLPDSQIDWVVDEEFAGLVRFHGGIDRVIALPLRRLSRDRKISDRVRDIAAVIKGFFKIRGQRYDLLIDMQGVIKSAVVSWFAKSGQRWTYTAPHLESPGLARWYTNFWEPARDLPAVFQYRVFAGVALGYTPDLNQTQFAFKKEAALVSAAIGTQNAGPGSTALLVPFSSKEAKQLDNQGMSVIVTTLRTRGYKIALVAGSEAERQRGLEIASLSNCEVEMIYRPIEHFDAFRNRLADFGICIGVDTGITHVSAAFGVPTIGIFSISAMRTYGPHHWAPHARSLHADDPQLIAAITEMVTQLPTAPSLADSSNTGWHTDRPLP
jgi:heptosyltransferase-1